MLMSLSVVRASLGAMSTEEEVHAFVAFLKDVFMEKRETAPMPYLEVASRNNYGGLRSEAVAY